MIHPLRVHYDKLLLVVALAALGGSLDWVRRQRAGVYSPDTEAAGQNPVAAAYVPVITKRLPASSAVWRGPVFPAQREGWLYELFTPPVMLYDAATRAFSLVATEPMVGESEKKSMASASPTADSASRQLHLVGYFGSPGNYLVAFDNPQSADTLLVRLGQPIGDLGLMLKAFEVRKVTVAETEFGPVYEMVALATLLDELSHQELVIDNQMRRPGELPATQTGSIPGPTPGIEVRRVAANSQ